jgi:hypothetical protein
MADKKLLKDIIRRYFDPRTRRERALDDPGEILESLSKVKDFNTPLDTENNTILHIISGYYNKWEEDLGSISACKLDIQFCIECGAGSILNAQNNIGNTPLHIAVKTGQNCINFLVQSGADIFMIKNHSVYDLAKSFMDVDEDYRIPDGSYCAPYDYEDWKANFEYNFKYLKSFNNREGKFILERFEKERDEKVIAVRLAKRQGYHPIILNLDVLCGVGSRVVWCEVGKDASERKYRSLIRESNTKKL